MNGHNAQEHLDAESIEVDGLDDFMTLLLPWHAERVRKLEALLQIPEGVEVSLDDKETIPLTGEVRTAFLIGITLGLNQLGKLPFAVEYEDAPDAPH